MLFPEGKGLIIAFLLSLSSTKSTKKLTEIIFFILDYKITHLDIVK